jgi:hypothetical protein
MKILLDECFPLDFRHSAREMRPSPYRLTTLKSYGHPNDLSDQAGFGGACFSLPTEFGHSAAKVGPACWPAGDML